MTFADQIELSKLQVQDLFEIVMPGTLSPVCIFATIVTTS